MDQFRENEGELSMRKLRICASILVITLICMLTQTQTFALTFKQRLDMLPPLLKMDNGETVKTVEQWEKVRRAEILDLLRENEYGYNAVERPENLTFEVVDTKENMMGGIATRKQVDITYTGPYGSGTIHLLLFVPTHTEPVPTLLLINNRPKKDVSDPERKVVSEFWPAEEMVERGYAAAVYYYEDVAADTAYDKISLEEKTSIMLSSGIFKAFEDPSEPRADNAWGAVGAWAWGASRIMDYLETDTDINSKQVAVVGHSRGAKAALWAGAQDERFAMVVGNSSDAAGAALFSGKQSGGSFQKIANEMSVWYPKNILKYAGQTENLPFDQHMLLALIAPRLLYIESSMDDSTTNPPSDFLGATAAEPAYALYGLQGLGTEVFPQRDVPIQNGNIAYHARTGDHNMKALDWKFFMDYADVQFKNAKPQKYKGDNKEKPVSGGSSWAVKGTPVIDGVIDEVWKNAVENKSDFFPVGSEGATAVFKVLWNEKNLYVLADVTDSVVSDNGTQDHTKDSIEIFIDEDNSKSPVYLDGDIQIRVDINNVNTGNGNRVNAATALAKTAVMRTDKGYRMEVAYPFQTIRGEAGKTVGFLLQVNDNKGTGKRDAYSIWNKLSKGPKVDSAYYNTSVFGELKLITTAEPYMGASAGAKAELDRAAEKGLVTESIRENMGESITREEFCEVVVKLYEGMTGKKAAFSDTTAFTDTKNPGVFMAYGLNIVKGVGNNKFKPAELISREQAAVILFRAMKAIKADVNVSGSLTEKFSDEDSISTWAMDSTKFMSKKGILQKTDEGKIAPKGEVTREQAVIMALTMVEKLK